MRTVRNLKRMAKPRRGTVLALGTFDGVHTGHQAIIRRVIRGATRCGAASAVVTFDPPPAVVLGKRADPAVLTPISKKLALIESLGVDLCVLVPFTPALARTRAETFVERVLVKGLGARCILVGEGYRFGRDRTGCARLLGRLGKQFGFGVVVLKPVAVGGRKVSSTAIRKLVRRGALGEARRLLGRPYSILGRVVKGERRGRVIGYPTANIASGAQLLPPDGVYAGRVRVGKEPRRGLLYIGCRPTFGPRGRRQAEVYLLDFGRNLYRQFVEFELVGRLRGDQAFPDAGALNRQIRRDEALARRMLSRQ